MTKPSKAIAKTRGPLNGLIADRMRYLGFETVKDFADHAGISRTSLHELIRGRATTSGAWTKPSIDTLAKLAIALNRPLHELIYIIAPEALGAEEFTKNRQQPMIERIPVYIAGCVGAGPQQLTETDEYITVEREFTKNRDLVAFRVVGDSMAGGKRPIHDDDIVVVDRNAEPEINSPIVARLTGNGYVVKRLRPGGFLDSTNTEYTGPHAVVNVEGIDQLVGRVVRVQSSF